MAGAAAAVASATAAATRGSPEWRAIRDHYHGHTPWYEYELRAPSSDGEPRFVLLRGKVAERDARGKPVRIIGTVTDVTERKRMQAQLLQSDRMVSMGTLAAGVAHEINNPLAYVVSNLGFVLSELAAAGVDSAHAEGASRTLPGEVLGEMRRALEEAKEGAERVRAIVRDLKTFSRPDESARAEVDPASGILISISVLMTGPLMLSRCPADLSTSTAA